MIELNLKLTIINNIPQPDIKCNPAAFELDRASIIVEHNTLTGFPERIQPLHLWFDEEGALHASPNDPNDVEAEIAPTPTPAASTAAEPLPTVASAR